MLQMAHEDGEGGGGGGCGGGSVSIREVCSTLMNISSEIRVIK